MTKHYKLHELTTEVLVEMFGDSSDWYSVLKNGKRVGSFSDLRKAIKIENPLEQEKLISHFLKKNFYHKYAGWYNSHKGRHATYYGYWSFESAAIVAILDLDDSSFRDNQYYPKDLVDYYRSTQQNQLG